MWNNQFDASINIKSGRNGNFMSNKKIRSWSRGIGKCKLSFLFELQKELNKMCERQPQKQRTWKNVSHMILDPQSFDLTQQLCTNQVKIGCDAEKTNYLSLNQPAAKVSKNKTRTEIISRSWVQTT